MKAKNKAQLKFSFEDKVDLSPNLDIKELATSDVCEKVTLGAQSNFSFLDEQESVPAAGYEAISMPDAEVGIYRGFFLKVKTYELLDYWRSGQAHRSF